MKSYSGGRLVAGALIGVGVGVGLVLLLAPQSGSKTRKALREGTDGLKGRANRFVANIKERNETFHRDVKEGADDYRKEMMAKIG